MVSTPASETDWQVKKHFLKNMPALSLTHLYFTPCDHEGSINVQKDTQFWIAESRAHVPWPAVAYHCRGAVTITWPFPHGLALHRALDIMKRFPFPDNPIILP